MCLEAGRDQEGEEKKREKIKKEERRSGRGLLK
jgi:hypothetical protein